MFMHYTDAPPPSPSLYLQTAGMENNRKDYLAFHTYYLLLISVALMT